MTTTHSTGPAPSDMTGMRAALAAGRVTASALVDRAIERAEAVNPQLNFIAWPTFERARGQAGEARPGPLAGVPTLIKDMLPEKGIPASFGSAALRDFIPPDDAPYARAINGAGLISIARSAMPELGLNAVTESPLLGPTRNPWSLDHTPGGSSGGGAAAVAAGVVPVAHASDGLGSIRHGAAPCGLVGLKPSRGRNAGEEAFRSIADLTVNGCVSRTVRDTAAWLEATQTRDPSCLPPTPLVTAPVEHRLRIHAYSRVMRTGALPDASVGRVFGEAIALLDRLGHAVADAGLPFEGPAAMELLGTITEGMFSRRLGMLSQAIGIAIKAEDLEHRSATLVAAGEAIGDAEFAAAWTAMEAVVAAYLDRLEAIDIWMTPTLGSEIPRIGVFGPDISWDDQKDPLIDYAGYCWIDNFAGTPAISLPIGFSDNGLPVGVQFATRPGGEALLLALAYQLEAALQWQRHIPPIWAGDP
ncbi:Aspartyl-tRNA(Asn) amidotransferase subunit A/Glutamyl-tRNA(Gln) amidotransferase subunit A [uncultured Sphingopyxis sp.]|uniref:Aspartyl-tRNA(Asn) amidotransferase subunit A/Glutamyl-tRNA(Gln) amidotransferase subunit A n=1 Tax=uncultured Sphingopyxis sp. TaxID=310581 RepID=A0A1Y5PWB2_9SPHN|nr:amidase family protein [uncultured Sphingopyxis sp.]SBV34271.1 Aspartyl-tRNA(Asn) amidotransferase subunit A/Glutamyl-tRNA(Gln) amidotransferase subunit A [uncultured Sphingopyxis sp.]